MKQTSQQQRSYVLGATRIKVCELCALPPQAQLISTAPWKMRLHANYVEAHEFHPQLPGRSLQPRAALNQLEP